MIGKYKNTLRVPDMTHRNDDGIMPKYWVSIFGDELRLVTDVRDLRNEGLSRNIYFSATNFPHTTRFDCTKPSVFSDWLALSSNYICTVTGDTVEITEVPKIIKYDSYQERVFNHVANNIHRIFSIRPYAVLFYSGGVDSMAILSFIKALGYLHRTHVVFSKNMTQSQATYLIPDRMSKILEMRDILKNECLSFDMVETTTDDIVEIFNRFNGNHLRLLTYCSSHCETKYQNSVMIEGTGDAVHLHTKQVLHGIITANNSFERFTELKSRPFYSADTLSYSPSDDNISFENVVFRSKMYRRIDRINNNCFAQPIVDNNGFDLIRQLDLHGIDVVDSMDALIPKSFIRRNVGSLFDSCIMSEYAMDFDIINSVMLPIKELNLENYSVPLTLNHNADGLRFLTEEIARFSKDKDGVVNLNTLISISTMQYLETLLDYNHA